MRLNMRPLPLSCAQWINFALTPRTPDRPGVAHDLVRKTEASGVWKHATEGERIGHS